MRKIKADEFILDDMIILENNEKSFTGVSNTIDRLVKLKVSVMELQNLVCSPTNFIQLFELLT